jgi:hypothetical protein
MFTPDIVADSERFSSGSGSDFSNWLGPDPDSRVHTKFCTNFFVPRNFFQNFFFLTVFYSSSDASLVEILFYMIHSQISWPVHLKLSYEIKINKRVFLSIHKTFQHKKGLTKFCLSILVASNPVPNVWIRL